MKKVAFLCSGGGGNLKFLNRCVQEGLLKSHHLAGVVADRECGALQFAVQNKIPAYQVDYSQGRNSALQERLDDLDAQIIVTNIHKILDGETVRRYSGKLINLHYSLLPAFKGMIGEKPVRMAFDQGCKFTGATVHRVNEEVDGGEILSQAVMPLEPQFPFEQTMDKVFKLGCLLLLNSLELLEKGMGHPRGPFKIDPVAGHFFNPPLLFDERLFTEGFWSKIK